MLGRNANHALLLQREFERIDEIVMDNWRDVDLGVNGLSTKTNA